MPSNCKTGAREMRQVILFPLGLAAIGRTFRSLPESFSRGVLGLLLLILATPPATLSAQSTFGTVRGTVLDQSGGIIPLAQITLHSLDENSNVTVLSDDHGNFAFENLKPGHYTIRTAKEGFAIAVVNQLELTARQTLRVDVTLSVAAQAQSVEVAVAAESVNT
jgi:hypothetical protein